MSRSRPTSLSACRVAEKSLTGKSLSAAIDRSRNNTCNATGLRRWPAQAGQVTGSPPSAGAPFACAAPAWAAPASRHVDSSPLCSASNCSNCSPVPKQLLHQPCLELKEKSRGSSSGKPVPQLGQARLVEKTLVVAAAVGVVAPGPDSTCTTPRPCSNAESSA